MFDILNIEVKIPFFSIYSYCLENEHRSREQEETSVSELSPIGDVQSMLKCFKVHIHQEHLNKNQTKLQ